MVYCGVTNERLVVLEGDEGRGGTVAPAIGHDFDMLVEQREQGKKGGRRRRIKGGR